MIRSLAAWIFVVTRPLCCSLVLVLTLCAGLSACGQKGDLYLPEKNAPAATPASGPGQ